jgi:hypothetical protein
MSCMPEKPTTYNSQSCDRVDIPDDTCGEDGRESLITLGGERAGDLVTLFAPLAPGPERSTRHNMRCRIIFCTSEVPS